MRCALSRPRNVRFFFLFFSFSAFFFVLLHFYFLFFCSFYLLYCTNIFFSRMIISLNSPIIYLYCGNILLLSYKHLFWNPGFFFLTIWTLNLMNKFFTISWTFFELYPYQLFKFIFITYSYEKIKKRKKQEKNNGNQLVVLPGRARRGPLTGALQALPPLRCSERHIRSSHAEYQRQQSLGACDDGEDDQACDNDNNET
jgi:hypothetical protein